jgi:lycopene beta-cyclase
VFDTDLARLHRRHRSQVRFAHGLNLLLFRCFEPATMWNVFARFYTLPEDLIRRFYAMSLTRTDQARIVVGRPPRGFSLAIALASRRMG